MYQRLKKKLAKNFSKTSELTLFPTKGLCQSTPWLYHPSDIATHITIPNELQRFLVGLLTGDPTSTTNTSKKTDGGLYCPWVTVYIMSWLNDSTRISVFCEVFVVLVGYPVRSQTRNSSNSFGMVM